MSAKLINLPGLLANIVGVTRQTTSSIETGQYCPSALLAVIVAGGLTATLYQCAKQTLNQRWSGEVAAWRIMESPQTSLVIEKDTIPVGLGRAKRLQFYRMRFC